MNLYLQLHRVPKSEFESESSSLESSRSPNVWDLSPSPTRSGLQCESKDSSSHLCYKLLKFKKRILDKQKTKAIYRVAVPRAIAFGSMMSVSLQAASNQERKISKGSLQTRLSISKLFPGSWYGLRISIKNIETKMLWVDKSDPHTQYYKWWESEKSLSFYFKCMKTDLGVGNCTRNHIQRCSSNTALWTRTHRHWYLVWTEILVRKSTVWSFETLVPWTRDLWVQAQALTHLFLQFYPR